MAFVEQFWFFGSVLWNLELLEPHYNTLLEPPSQLGGMLARLRSLLKIGLFGASFDFASFKLVVSSVFSALPQFNCLLCCASYSELHFRQSQKGRLIGRGLSLGLGSGFGSVA